MMVPYGMMVAAGAGFKKTVRNVCSLKIEPIGFSAGLIQGVRTTTTKKRISYLRKSIWKNKVTIV